MTQFLQLNVFSINLSVRFLRTQSLLISGHKESAKSRGWRGQCGCVGGVGQILAGVAWVAWVHNMLVWVTLVAWVARVHKILAWVEWVEIFAWVRKGAPISCYLMILYRKYYVFYSTLYNCTNRIHQALQHTYFISHCFNHK